MKPKVGIVTCRFAKEISGGAEIYTLRLAERLSPYWDITILTTCGTDYNSWKQVYTPGDYPEDGYQIKRFLQEPVNKEKLENTWQPAFRDGHTWEDEQPWFQALGPYCPKLWNYLKSHINNYDFYIFIGYFWATTNQGLPLVAKKSILIPTAHDEFNIHLLTFQRLFHLPAAIVYLTPEEKFFVNDLFMNQDIPSEIMGMELEVHPEQVNLHI